MVVNSFERGPQGWCSYDYHASMVDGGVNVFILSTWQRSGGVNDGGYVWVDNTRWSADTPEKPLSILPLLFYRSWIDADPLDLRDAQVSVYLRGDKLKLDGASCYFWVCGMGTRWHLTSQPLAISDGRWATAPLRFKLVPDPQLWHQSWDHLPGQGPSVEVLLSQVPSYGFSFVGFTAEVTGRLSMDEFQITLAAG